MQECTELVAALPLRDEVVRREALRHMHLSRQLWTSVESRHATRLRLEIAALQLEIGEVGAAAEIGAASAVSNELGSDKLKKRATALQQRL